MKCGVRALGSLLTLSSMPQITFFRCLEAVDDAREEPRFIGMQIAVRVQLPAHPLDVRGVVVEFQVHDDAVLFQLLQPAFPLVEHVLVQRFAGSKSTNGQCWSSPSSLMLQRRMRNI